MQSAAPTRNEAVHPNRSPIHGVSEAVMKAPITLAVFINPETEPDDVPAMSAVTDQNELCET